MDEGAKGTDYQVIYIADDGKIENIPTTYNAGYIEVELEHFSEYAIVKLAEEAPITADDSGVALWIGMLAMSAVVCAGMSAVSKKRAYTNR